MSIRRTLCVLLVLLMLALPGPGRAQLPVIDHSNLIQNTLQAVRILTQISQLAEQIRIMLQNTVPLTAVWPQFAELLRQLALLIEQEEALAYSLQNLDAVFRQKFPSYVPPRDYRREYHLWTETVLDTLRGALNMLHEQDLQFVLEQGRISALAGLSEAAIGRMQAIQAGNAIMAEMATHLVKLRQLVMTQIDSQNTYLAQQLNHTAQIDALTTAWLTGGTLEFPVQVQGTGFRDIPSRERVGR